MNAEQEVARELVEHAGLNADKVRVARARRVFAEVEADKFIKVIQYAVEKMDFAFLCTITGQDEGENMSAMYHLARETGMLLNLKVCVPKDHPVLPTVTALFPAANVYEHEIKNLLGFRIEGLNEESRYPLSDDWPMDQHPLRKDWDISMLEGKEKTANG